MENLITIRETGIKVTDILRLMAEGLSYQQILEKHRTLVTGDIMSAVSLALDLMEQYVTPEHTISVNHEIRVVATSGKIVNLSRLREEFPRAYEPWKPDEEVRFADAYTKGVKVSDLASTHQRQPGAVRSRLLKLGLLERRPGQAE